MPTTNLHPFDEDIERIHLSSVYRLFEIETVD